MCADGEELLSFDELPAFAYALGVAQRANGGAPDEDAKPPPKVALLQRQLVAAVHQYFRKRWPLRLPDWSEEERARGLDRPTNNRTFEGFSLDLRAVGVEYINAALVAGIPPSQVSYVVTQHPLRTSISDFWKMVVAVQPAAILMLNGATEPEDIDLPPYWLPSSLPSDGSGPELEAAALPQLEEVGLGKADVVARALRCTWRGASWAGPHLTVPWWVDQSAPPMERFLALERSLEQLFTMGPTASSGSSPGATTPRPVVVHCAAGIGRAGVFLAADLGARAAALGGPALGPDRLVGYLRQRRANMVQTADQYEFLHLVLPQLAAQLKGSGEPPGRNGREGDAPGEHHKEPC